MKYIYASCFLALFILPQVSCNSGQGRVPDPSENEIPVEPLPGTCCSRPPEKVPVLTFTRGILAVFEDSKGNFWFGSRGEGVCCYDGHTYTYYTSDQGLPEHNYVRVIEEDDRGNIWFDGRSFFDGERIHTLEGVGEWDALKTRANRFKSSSASWELIPGAKWFSVPNDGILRYDGKKLDYLAFPIPKEDTLFVKGMGLTYMPAYPFFPYYVLTTLKDREGRMWFGTQSRGVVGYDGEGFTYFNPDSFGNATICSLFQDRSGVYWFGSNGGGLYRYDGKQYRNFTAEHGLDNPGFCKGDYRDMPGTLARVWAINQDNEGNLWFGTADAGVWRYDGKNLINYTIEDGLTDNFVSAIYKDREGKMWFVTMSGDLCTFNGHNFRVYYRAQKRE